MSVHSSGTFWDWNLKDFHEYVLLMLIIYTRVKIKEMKRNWPPGGLIY
jgi:hypothetical protein